MTVIFQENPGKGYQNATILDYIAAKDDRVVVTTEAIRRAELQSNLSTKQTNTQSFTGQMPFLSPNAQSQSIEWSVTFEGTCSPQPHLGPSNLVSDHYRLLVTLEEG